MAFDGASLLNVVYFFKIFVDNFLMIFADLLIAFHDMVMFLHVLTIIFAVCCYMCW